MYTSDSQLKYPRQLFASMFADLGNARELAWRLFVRNIKAQYRQTIFGYLWAFLPAIITTATFVFLNSRKILNVEQTDLPYPVYVMIGTLLWQCFVDALNSLIKLVNQSRSMLVKINFPREALILTAFYEVMFNFSIRLILFVGVIIWFNISVPVSILLAPVGVLSIMLFGIMLGIVLTPLAMLYKDIERGLLAVTSIWFFLTPIVYPAPKSGIASVLALWNPLSPLILSTREWITAGFTADIIPFITVTLITIALTGVAWLVYRLAMPHLIARIGS